VPRGDMGLNMVALQGGKVAYLLFVAKAD